MSRLTVRSETCSARAIWAVLAPPAMSVHRCRSLPLSCGPVDGADGRSAVPVYETPSNAVDEGAAAARVLLDVPADRRPTAIIAQSDVLAAGVLQAAAELGLQVPDDLSVGGFDGAELHWLAPTRLTTVVQPSEEKGRAAARAAMDLVEGGDPVSIMLPVALRIGTTSGRAPSSDRSATR